MFDTQAIMYYCRSVMLQWIACMCTVFLSECVPRYILCHATSDSLYVYCISVRVCASLHSLLSSIASI